VPILAEVLDSHGFRFEVIPTLSCGMWRPMAAAYCRPLLDTVELTTHRFPHQTQLDPGNTCRFFCFLTWGEEEKRRRGEKEKRRRGEEEKGEEEKRRRGKEEKRRRGRREEEKGEGETKQE